MLQINSRDFSIGGMTVSAMTGALFAEIASLSCARFSRPFETYPCSITVLPRPLSLFRRSFFGAAFFSTCNGVECAASGLQFYRRQLLLQREYTGGSGEITHIELKEGMRNTIKHKVKVVEASRLCGEMHSYLQIG